MMNINMLMKQAQQMQAKAAKLEKELAAKEYTKSANGGAIEIKATGAKQITAITIDEDLLEKDNKEILEDMLLVALNELLNEINEDSEAAMAKISGGMKVPGLF